MNLFSRIPAVLLTIIALAASAANAGYAQAPTHKVFKNNLIDPNINAYWEYLPRNYATDTDVKYPLIIWLHGYGESGSDHSTATLNKVLNSSLPAMIAANRFPESVVSNGNATRFIVLSPQIKDGIDVPTRSSIILPSAIDAMIKHASDMYRVDASRIYLCGMSMGGGAILDYLGSSNGAARKIAAAAIACPAADLSVSEADVLGTVGVPLVVTHNRADVLVYYDRSVASMNTLALEWDQPAPAPVFVTYDVASPDEYKHNAWTRTFEHLVRGAVNDPNVINTLGTNVYEWLLRSSIVAEPVPVTWKNFGLRKTSAGVMAEWSVSNQVNVAVYNIQRSTDGINWSQAGTRKAVSGNGREWYYQFTDSTLPAGSTHYRIQSVDFDGKLSYTVTKTFRPDNAEPDLFAVFPNPFGTRITVSFEKQANRSLRAALYNAAGLLVDSKFVQTAGQAGRFDLNNTSKLARGLYFLHITTEDGQPLFKSALIKRD